MRRLYHSGRVVCCEVGAAAKRGRISCSQGGMQEQLEGECSRTMAPTMLHASSHMRGAGNAGLDVGREAAQN
jgi:hypothetical protein